MTVRALKCPKCTAGVNVLATMQTIRCPACGNVFSAAAAATAAAASAVASPAASRGEQALRDAAADSEQPAAETDSNSTLILVAICGGLAMVVLLCAVGIYTLTRSDNSAAEVVTGQPKPVLREPTAEELAALQIVSIPEDQRRRIYDDVRASARTTTEKALMVPGSNVRAKLENMLDATHENSLRQLAALHDITVDEVRDIVLEGDLKNWDPRARSRVYRDGQRVFTDERAQGFQEKNPLK